MVAVTAKDANSLCMLQSTRCFIYIGGCVLELSRFIP